MNRRSTFPSHIDRAHLLAQERNKIFPSLSSTTTYHGFGYCVSRGGRSLPEETKIIVHVVRSAHLLKRRKRSALLPDVGLVHLVSQHNHLFVDSHLSASMWRRGIGGAGYGRVKQLACWTAVAVNLTTLSILNLRRISCLHLSNWGATCQQRLAGLTTFYYLLPRFATNDHRFCCSLKAWTTKYRDCYTQNESGCGDKRSAIVSRPNRYWCGSPKRRCL